MNYKKRIKKCAMFGAIKFQKVVFKIEDIRRKFIRKVCPNFIKYCYYKTKRKLKKDHSDIVKKQIIDYKKRIKKCKMLGALKFQKVVFKIEDIRWKFIRKVCPNFIKYCDKYCDYKTKKKLKKVHSDIVKKQIIDANNLNKILIRKEFNHSQNRNYHINKNNPNEFMKYLELNKKIHVFGLKYNLISIPVLLAFSVAFTPSVPLLVFNLLSMFINFQCINIQNYNINRLKGYQQKLQRKTLENRGDITREQEYQIKQRRREREYEQTYSKSSDLIHQSIEKSNKILNIGQIIDNIENRDQLTQLRNQLVKALSETETKGNSTSGIAWQKKGINGKKTN